jgi:hypothetical protein
MTTCELKSKVSPNFLPNSAQRCRVFDNSIPGNYRVIIGYLAQHKLQFGLLFALQCDGVLRVQYRHHFRNHEVGRWWSFLAIDQKSGEVWV